MWSVDVDLFGTFVPCYWTEIDVYAEYFLNDLKKMASCRMIRRPKGWYPLTPASDIQRSQRTVAVYYTDIVWGDLSPEEGQALIGAEMNRLAELLNPQIKTRASRMAECLVQEPNDELEDKLLEEYGQTEERMLRIVTHQKIRLILTSKKVPQRFRDILIQLGRMLFQMDIDELEEVNEICDWVHDFYLNV